MGAITLKDCPFCGSRPVTRVRNLYGEYRVICKDCGCGTGPHPTKSIAIEHWERRQTRYARNKDTTKTTKPERLHKR